MRMLSFFLLWEIAFPVVTYYHKTEKAGKRCMANKKYTKLLIIAVVLLILCSVIYGLARLVFLFPTCYSDSKDLTDRENYFIKKAVLEAIADRCSVFGNGSGDSKKVFLWINGDFMKSVEKTDNGYTVSVQTHFMESESDDCVYEIHFDSGYLITSFLLDP